MKHSQRLMLYLPCMAITCWYGMMLVHESGHMLVATLTGVKVEQLEFPLLGFSRTDVPSNPHSSAIVWGGPLFGAAAPLSAWLIISLLKYKSHLLHIFAAFCLLANGLYIGAGSFARIGDAGDMLKSGSPKFCLWCFGFISTAAGFYLLHRLGPKLGSALVKTSDLTIATAAAAALLMLSLLL